MQEKPLKWKNLKENKCPKCNKDFMNTLATLQHVLYHPCGFVISEFRYSQIVSSQINRDLEEKYLEDDI